jgi:DNA-binding NarL/FixJ family response regulator
VLLAGGQPLWLEAVQTVVEGAGFAVCGAAANANEALAMVSELKPDLVIADVDEGELDTGFVRSIAEENATTRVVGLTLNADTGHIASMLGAGATAVVLKTAQPADLAAAISQSFSSSVFFAAAIRPEEVSQVRLARDDSTERLTRREIEILRLVAEGHSNSQLAHMLWVTEQTVKFHLSNVYRKLHVANRTEASRWAQLHGLLNIETAAAA